MVFLIALVVLFFIVVIIFSFPRFSPIPYYPSNMDDWEKILKALRLRNGQTVIDLGAGDGVVIFRAAREAFRHDFDTHFVALELNPVLILILHIRRLLHPNRNHIRIVWGDMFKIDYSAIGGKDITFYLYISPWLIEQAVSHALSYYPAARFVSYYYPVKSMKKREQKDKGVHSTFVYEKS